jgi:hypothetical protein
MIFPAPMRSECAVLECSGVMGPETNLKRPAQTGWWIPLPISLVRSSRWSMERNPEGWGGAIQPSSSSAANMDFDYLKIFGGLPIVGDLPAGLALWALLFSTAVVALWKGGSDIRFGAVGFTSFAFILSFAGFAGGSSAAIICWILAWICVALGLSKSESK